MKKVKYIGLDVHKETIAVSVFTEKSKEPVLEKIIKNDPTKIIRFFQTEMTGFKVISCYEAGCFGFGLHKLLSDQKVNNLVVAPNKVPRKPGDKIKTDRRDARLLARMLQANQLTSIHIPSQKNEMIRNLIRAREDAVMDLRKDKQRLLSFFLRNGYKFEEGYWTEKHYSWMKKIEYRSEIEKFTFSNYHFQIEQSEGRLKEIESKIIETAESEEYRERIAKLRCFKGIDYVTAMSLVVEIGDFNRFAKAEEFMSYLGLIPSEYSSGNSRRQGHITKSGNHLLRRLLTESAWHYARSFVAIGKRLSERRAGQPVDVIAYTDKAMIRLRKKYARLVHRGKNSKTAAIAVARELSGFIWGVMTGNMA